MSRLSVAAIKLHMVLPNIHLSNTAVVMVAGPEKVNKDCFGRIDLVKQDFYQDIF